MRASGTVAGALAWSAVSLVIGPQTPPPGRLPTFPAEAALVHLDAVVVDGQGRQVTGLRAVDFEIEANGKKRSAAGSVYVPLVPSSRLSPQATLAEARLSEGEARRVIAFVLANPIVSFDSASMSGSSGAPATMRTARQVSDLLETFLEREWSSRDLVAILRSGEKSGPANQFTGDPELLRRAVQEMRDKSASLEITVRSLGPGTLDWSELVRENLRIVSDLDELVGRLARVQGRKLVVVCSRVIRLQGSMPGGEFNRVEQAIARLIRRANRAGVTLYAVQPSGLGSGFSEALEYLTEGTGGSAVSNTNDLQRGLGRILEENRGYYLLGYEASDAVSDKPQRVKIRVRRPGLQVRVRPEAFLGTSLSLPAGNVPDARALELLNTAVERK